MFILKMMEQKEFENWEIHDPDKVFSHSDIALRAFADGNFECENISPREDLVQCVNRLNGRIVDFGHYGYGCGSAFDGYWVIHVIDSNCDWQHPLSKIELEDFVSAVRQTREFLQEYNF